MPLQKRSSLLLRNGPNIQVVKVLFCKIFKVGLQTTSFSEENISSTCDSPVIDSWIYRGCRFLCQIVYSTFKELLKFLNFSGRSSNSEEPSAASLKASVLLSVRHVQITFWEMSFRVSISSHKDVHFKTLQKAQTRTQSALMHSSVELIVGGATGARLAGRLTNSFTVNPVTRTAVTLKRTGAARACRAPPQPPSKASLKDQTKAVTTTVHSVEQAEELR